MMEMEMLNTTESFEDLSRKANDIQAMCVDYKVPVDSLVMTERICTKKMMVLCAYFLCISYN